MTEEIERRCRVGMDLVMVEDVSDAMAKLGDRYLQRIYTPHELECCSGEAPVAAAGLAARFAAKEATIKVLRPSGAQPDWRSIEVVRSPSGACDLHLSGKAAILAQQAGISELSLSLSHEGTVAGAVVVALSEGPPLPPTAHGKIDARTGEVASTPARRATTRSHFGAIRRARTERRTVAAGVGGRFDDGPTDQ